MTLISQRDTDILRTRFTKERGNKEEITSNFCVLLFQTHQHSQEIHPRTFIETREIPHSASTEISPLVQSKREEGQGH